MQINELFSINPKKIEALKRKIEELNIDLQDIDESFSKGGGKGGQKVNKSNNCVHLLHLPTGIRVRCHKERERNKNRFLALRELINEIETKLHPEKSQKIKNIEKIRKQKKRRARKNKTKE